MNIFVIGFDRDLLDETSVASKRQMALAESAGVTLNIFLISRVDRRVDLNIGDRIRVHGREGNAVFRLLSIFFTAAREIRAAKKRGERTVITAQDPFIAGAMAFKLSRWTDVPYEIQEHGDFYSGYWEKEIPFVNRFFWCVGRFILRRADGIRVVSERVRDHLVRRCGVGADRIIVNPVSMDLSWNFSRQARPWPEVPTIVVPCRFVRQKGLDTLISALSRLTKKGVKYRARLIGKGPLEAYLRRKIVHRGLGDCVAIEPWALRPEIEWGDADLFVCSSRYEGWGRTIVEAMAAGVPIVTTEVGCVGSLLRPQVDGRVVQPNNAEALARSIEQHLAEPERRSWMVNNARERIKTVMPAPDASINVQRDAWQRIIQTELVHSSRRAWVSAAALIAFATAIRAVSFLLFWKTLGANREGGFFTLVWNWFLGHGYSFVSAAGCASAYRSPGYLFFLTGVYGLFGFANYFAQALIQNIFAVLLVYLVYRLGWAISNDRRVGLVAGFIIALHPYAFYHYTQYYHTVLSGCFLVGLLLALITLERSKKWRWAVVSGLLIAALAYIQGTILPATAFLSLWLFVRWWPDWKRALGAIALMAAVSVAMIVPWTYRNWRVFHALVPLTTDLGHALAKANNDHIYRWTALGYPQEAFDEAVIPGKSLSVRYFPLPEVAADFSAHGWTVPPGFFFGEEHPLEPGLRQTCAEQEAMNEVAFNEYWLDLGTTWLKERYWSEGWKLQAQKIIQFWSPSLQPTIKYGAAWSFGNEGTLATLVKWSLTLYVVILELFGLAGLVLAVRRKRFAYAVPILVIFAVYTVMHSFFAGYTKYRIPLDNLLVILAAMPVVWLWDGWRKRGEKN